MRTSEGDLRGQLHRLRRQQQVRLPWPRPLFVQIYAVVEKYGLDENFLKMIEDFAETPPLTPGRDQQIRLKEPLALPLFALATPEEYGLIMAIIAKVNNPYLPYAYSPEEILACRPLFRCNSAIDPEKLASNHLLALLWGEIAGAEPDKRLKI